jgi:predicted Zn-dependent protease
MTREEFKRFLVEQRKAQATQALTPGDVVSALQSLDATERNQALAAVRSKNASAFGDVVLRQLREDHFTAIDAEVEGYLNNPNLTVQQLMTLLGVVV